MLNIPGITHFPGASVILGLCWHSNPGAHLPAEYVGGQKHDPQTSPNCLRSKIIFDFWSRVIIEYYSSVLENFTYIHWIYLAIMHASTAYRYQRGTATSSFYPLSRKMLICIPKLFHVGLMSPSFSNQPDKIYPHSFANEIFL